MFSSKERVLVLECRMDICVYKTNNIMGIEWNMSLSDYNNNIEKKERRKLKRIKCLGVAKEMMDE